MWKRFRFWLARVIEPEEEEFWDRVRHHPNRAVEFTVSGLPTGKPDVVTEVPIKSCQWCGDSMTYVRKNKRFCSKRCTDASYRARQK